MLSRTVITRLSLSLLALSILSFAACSHERTHGDDDAYYRDDGYYQYPHRGYEGPPPDSRDYNRDYHHDYDRHEEEEHHHDEDR